MPLADQIGEEQGERVAGSPPTVTAEQLADARAAMAEPEKLSLRSAAARVGVTLAALRRALAGGRLAPTAGAPSGALGGPAGRPAGRQAPKGASTSNGAPAGQATTAAPRPEPKPAPPPVKLAADPLDELRAYAEELRGRMKDQPAGSAEFRALGVELRKVVADMERIRRGRPLVETPESRAAAARPAAEAALGKIRSGIAAWAAREAKTGECCRCGAALSPETIVRRRTEAGLDQPAVH